VASFGERCLAAGRDFVVTSVGALTSDQLYDDMQAAAAGHGGGRLMLASGAMPAVDWMHSSMLAGDVDAVTFTQIKPPKSWAGARYDPDTGEPAEDAYDFASVRALA
jgi:predicted dinucleotide-utilizing enzyme